MLAAERAIPKTAHQFQLHPTALGIQGTNPRQLPTEGHQMNKVR